MKEIHVIIYYLHLFVYFTCDVLTTRHPYASWMIVFLCLLASVDKSSPIDWHALVLNGVLSPELYFIYETISYFFH